MSARLLSVVVFVWSVALWAADTPRGELLVHVEGIRNDQGSVLVALFDQEQGFPGDHARSRRRHLARIQGGKASFKLTGLSPGTYALALVHDENGNEKMDRNFLGIPKEGFGFSNNPKVRFGPPSFKAAAFVIETETLTLKIRMSYL